MTNKKTVGRTRLRSGILSGALALAIGISAFSPAATYGSDDTRGTHRESEYINLETGKIEYTLPGITTRRLAEHSQRTLSVNGKVLSEPAVVMNGTIYLPLRAFASSLGNATVSYNKSTKTATLTMPGLHLSATDAGYVTYANDRALFSFSPNLLMSNGKMYLAASVLTKALGVRITSETRDTVSIAGSYTPLAHASKFYREDEVYWLAKIISAESGGESLIGQIAVGDVILNRVQSPLYPGTIYGVIFDRKYGVQFSPTLDGSIYKDPTFTATLAAKICLEGTSLSDDALFFLNPRVAQSNWIVKSREYAYTIGGHDFYL
jgi:N-acetylmuramoyl-L-alanine amidase